MADIVIYRYNCNVIHNDMKHIFAAIITVVMISAVYSQNPHDYTRVTNQGPLPPEVYTPSTIKFQSEIANIEADLSKKAQKTQQEYYLESGFSIDEMMRSGLVLYNPEYNAYLESIADVLLEDYPDLRASVHFYVLKTPVVNAFAGAGGNIFISMGLIAMLENEAELAFVMGHEIGHIAKEHGLDFYVEAKEIDKKSSNNSLLKKSSSFNESLVVKNLYSQVLETEADDYGIQSILNSRYLADTVSLNAVFDVLKYAYLPYENESFPIDFFESNNYVTSKNLKLDSIKKIAGEPEYLEKKEAFKSTHPSIGDRRKSVFEKIDNVPVGGSRKAYIVSEEKFMKMRNVARFELPMYYLHNHLYQDAIYVAYLGLQKDPYNIYLQKIIAKSLTGLSKFRNAKDDEVYAEKARFEEYEGEQQQLYYMLWAMSDVELNVLALDYTFRIHLNNPQDPEVMPLCRSLINDLVFYHFNDEEDFLMGKTIARDSLYKLADIANPKIKVAAPSSKSKKVTRKTTVKAKRSTTAKIQADKNKKHLLYAYNDYWENKEFRRMWNEAVTERDEREAEAKEYKKAGIKYTNKGDTRNYFWGDHLGITKVVVVNPFYRRIDLRKDNAIEYVSSEEGELNYMEILKANAALLDVDLEILDPLKMSESDANSFNEMNELNDWFSEQLDFGNINMPGYNQNMVDSIATAMGTDYFLWTGIVSLRDKQNILGPVIYIALSPFFLPLLPYGVYELIKPEYEFFYLSLVYNVKTREAHVLKFMFLDNNDTRAILNSHTYEMLYQLSSPSKN
ncbi:MAG: M48 family metalloprotease [Bacteroidetes bacterium]|nr:M48 family metalloprotease [Bacteroidota bacterium]